MKIKYRCLALLLFCCAAKTVSGQANGTGLVISDQYTALSFSMINSQAQGPSRIDSARFDFICYLDQYSFAVDVKSFPTSSIIGVYTLNTGLANFYEVTPLFIGFKLKFPRSVDARVLVTIYYSSGNIAEMAMDPHGRFIDGCGMVYKNKKLSKFINGIYRSQIKRPGC